MISFRIKALMLRHASSHPQLFRLFKFVVSGGLGAFTDLAILYLLTDIIHLWYVVSTAVAFIVAFAVSFVLQKYWTFEDHSHDQIHGQVGIYFGVAVVNTFLNTLIVYFLVDFSHIYYLLGQVIASILIAGESYFVYRRLFKDNGPISGEFAAEKVVL